MSKPIRGLVAACLILAAGAAPAHGQALDDMPRGELVMVRAEPGASLAAASVLSALDRAVAVPALDIPELGITVYRTPGRTAVIPQAVERLDGVDWAARPAEWQIPKEEMTPRSVYEPTHVQAIGPPEREPLWTLQWPLERGAVGDIRGAWQVATGAGILVGVIDTAIDCSHVDVRCTHRANHYDALRRVELYELTARPDVVHGTHVAGIIAGEHNGRGIVGMAPDAEILGCRACSDGGTCSELDVAACIVHVAPRLSDEADGERGSVMNFSLGGTYGPRTPALCEGTSWAESRYGVLSVAAVGNHGPSLTPLYPATCGGVLGVAASIAPDGDRLADYSQRASVDLTAPGSRVASSVPGGWAYLDGTSMASPHVAGAAALLAEAMGESWSSGEAARLLTEYARRICGPVYQGRLCGWGALDVNGAVRAVMPVPPEQEEPPTVTPWWTDEPEPTPTTQPSATHIEAVRLTLTAMAASPTPSEAPTAAETPTPTKTLTPAATSTAPPAPTASRTATGTPTITPTMDPVDLTVTALWPTITPDISGTVAAALTAEAPTPDVVASRVATRLAPPTLTARAATAAVTEAAAATARATARHGPLFFPALLRVVAEPTPVATDPCRDVQFPWACPQRTRDAMATIEVEETATAAAGATQTAAAPPPAPTRSWPLLRNEAH